jgi:predicted ester cyclase
MTAEENKALIHQSYDLYNRHKLDACYELHSPDCIIHVSSGDITLEQNRQSDIMLHNAFPDLKCTILDMIAEGDKVAYVVNVTGTHTCGSYMGIQPTGKKINMTNTWIVKIVNHKIQEFRGTVELIVVLQQLGVIHGEQT